MMAFPQATFKAFQSDLSVPDAYLVWDGSQFVSNTNHRLPGSGDVVLADGTFSHSVGPVLWFYADASNDGTLANGTVSAEHITNFTASTGATLNATAGQGIAESSRATAGGQLNATVARKVSAENSGKVSATDLYGGAAASGGVINAGTAHVTDDFGGITAIGGTIIVSGNIRNETTAGGGLTIAGGSILAQNISSITNSRMSVTMTGGTLTVGDFDVGSTLPGSLTINQGGVAHISGTMASLLNLSIGGAGSTLDYSKQVVVGDTSPGNLTVTGGATQTLASVLAANNSGAAGSKVTVGGAGTTLDIQHGLSSNARTSVIVSSGAKLTVGDTLSLGNSNAGSNSLDIFGADSRLTAKGDFLLGNAGQFPGSSVQSGGFLDVFGDFSLGVQSTGNGNLSIRGAGSELQTHGNVIIGDAGTGGLSVFDQGVFDAALTSALNTVTLAHEANSSGGVLVGNLAQAANPAKLFANDLIVGDAGTGTFRTQGQAQVDVFNTLIVGNQANGHGSVTLQAPGSGVSGATLTAAAAIIGKAGTGSLSVGAKDTVTINGAMTLASEETGSGSVGVSSDGTLTIHGDLNGHVVNDLLGHGSKEASVSVSGTLKVDGSVALGGNKVFFDVQNGGIATVSGNFSVGGSHSALTTSDDSVSILGGSLDVKGNVAFGGALFDNVVINVTNVGSSSVGITTSTLFWGNTLTLSASAGASTTLTIGNGGTVAPQSQDTGGDLQLEGNATITVTGKQSELDGHNASLTSGASLNTTNNGKAVLTGFLLLKNSSAAANGGGSIEVQHGGQGVSSRPLDGAAPDTFLIDPGGLLAAGGQSSISAKTIDNSGRVEVADSGGSLNLLKVAGSVIGSGTFDIDAPRFSSSSMALEFTGPVAENSIVEFHGDHSTLQLDDPLNFKGSIVDFTYGDTIALAHIDPTKVEYKIFDAPLLKVFYGAGLELDLKVTGTFVNPTFTTTQDANGTSFITLNGGPAPPQQPAGDPQWNSSVDLGSHPAGWVAAGVSDFSGDGTSDVAWFNAVTGNIDIWKLANGQWAGSANVGEHPLGYEPVAFADFNHDGTGDVLWFNSTTHDVDLWKLSNGQWAGSVDVGTHPAGWTPKLTGDFNGDGTSDLAWYNPTTNDIDIWKIANGQWAGSVDVGSHPSGYQPALAGDFNGDGTSDIAWYNSSTGDVDIWKLSNGQWAGSVDVGLHPVGWQPLGAADFNKDGISDIAWYNPANNEVEVWLLDNKGHWAGTADIGLHPAGSVAIAVGDFDHNGVADIMWRDASGSHIENWLLALS